MSPGAKSSQLVTVRSVNEKQNLTNIVDSFSEHFRSVLGKKYGSHFDEVIQITLVTFVQYIFHSFHSNLFLSHSTAPHSTVQYTSNVLYLKNFCFFLTTVMSLVTLGKINYIKNAAVNKKLKLMRVTLFPELLIILLRIINNYIRIIKQNSKYNE